MGFLGVSLWSTQERLGISDPHYVRLEPGKVRRWLEDRPRTAVLLTCGLIMAHAYPLSTEGDEHPATAASAAERFAPSGPPSVSPAPGGEEASTASA